MRLDPRCSLLLLIGYLLTLASIQPGHNLLLGLLCLFPFSLLVAVPSRRGELLAQAAYVLPFSFAIAAVALLRGQTAQAVFFLLRSYVSILAVLITTRLVTTIELLRAMERLGAPRFLIIITEFLMRYLDVIRKEAEAMRLAAICRGGAQSKLIAASSLGMLFVRSLERSIGIHNAMLARGFNGSLPRIFPMQWHTRDSLTLLAAIVILATLRFTV